MTRSKISQYRRLLQKEVAYCVTCQPYDDGPVWILGDETDIEELLSNLDVPAAAWAAVVSGVNCPNCGNAIELGDVVGTKTAEELEWEHLQHDWDRKLRRSFDQFQAHLERWPYLGLAHPIGRRIARSISRMRVIVIEDQPWYRARVPNEGRSFDTSDVMPPNPNEIAVPEGRYNHFGQSCFYLAGDKETAMQEALQGQAGIAWVQEFSVSRVESVLDLEPGPHGWVTPGLDLLSYGLTFGGYLEREVQRAAGWKPEYFVPRFVADCARHAGRAGIKFRSSRTYGSNLVLFSWGEPAIRPVGEPKIHQQKRSWSVFEGDPPF